MRKIAILLIALMVVSVGFLSGCTNNQQGVITSTNPPANINTFASTNEGGLIRFYFLLEDANGVNTISDGHVKIEILDNTNNSLYTKEFDVKSSEFVDYQLKLTGQGIGKAYEWRVPITDINKGISSFGFGKAVLTFLTPEYKTLNAEDTLVQVPTYTQEELENMQEEEYERSAIIVNLVQTKGSFEVKVTKAGFFNKYEWDQQKQYFRVDMEVKNIGSKSEYFLPSGLAIIDSLYNQHEYTYGGTLNTYSSVYPGVTKKGYVLFEDVPLKETSVQLVFELGYDANYNQYLFKYTINLK